MSEQTLALIKPDGVRRGCVGEILRRVEARGYRIAGLRLLTPDRAFLERHYSEHVGKGFFEPLLEFMGSGPVVAAVLEGEGVIGAWRIMMGATDPNVAEPGTIRGDLARDWGTRVQQNLVHGSDGVESAGREIALWFPELG